MNCYAVKTGRKVGIYNTWAECQRQVENYPNATFKKFTNIEDAVNFIGGVEKVVPSKKIIDSPSPSTLLDKNSVIAYVDGSFNNDNLNIFSCGVIIFDGDDIKCFSEKFHDSELAKMRNVAGEIMGAEMAMEYCFKKEIKKLTIYYDYVGIREWCKGRWKANKIGTKKYKQFYEIISEFVDVDFIHVDAHTGDTYNEKADELAKDGLLKNLCHGIVHDDFFESENI